MIPNNNGLGPIQEPDLSNWVDNRIQQALYNLNCHQVGTINSFNASRQTAEITLNLLRIVGSRQVSYPMLVDCPVFVHSGGQGVITMPVSAGDTCLVLFNDRDIDNWFSTGNVVTPNSTRAHSLSDGFALVGFRSKANPVSGYPTDRVRFKYAGSTIDLGAKISLANELASLKSVLDSVVTALTALNGKTGPSAAAQIAAVTAQINLLTE